MNTELYLSFILASVILIMIPGPNVALIIAISGASGLRDGIITVLGTNLAQLIMLLITVFGLGAFMANVAYGFEVIRWFGIGYLVYLGIKTFRIHVVSEPKPLKISKRKLFLQGFFVSLTNPKTLLFFAAFFPQFLDPAFEIGYQLMVMTTTYILIALVLDCGWAILGEKGAKLIANSMFARFKNKITGALFLSAAFGLALVRKN